MRVILDGRTLTPAQVAAVAREGRPVSLDDAARARNAAAAEALAALLEAGTPVYGVTTGVGALRSRELGTGRAQRASAAPAAQPRLRRRPAALATAGARHDGGARQPARSGRRRGVGPSCSTSLLAALNAGFVPLTRELGSLGTGDLSVLADIALALLGEGRVWHAGQSWRQGPRSVRPVWSPPNWGPETESPS